MLRSTAQSGWTMLLFGDGAGPTKGEAPPNETVRHAIWIYKQP
jgi:hypothetical protein